MEEFAVNASLKAIARIVVVVCLARKKCRLKDRHPALSKAINDRQKNLALLRKNKETAKHTLDQFLMQIQTLCGNFFSIMRPRLKATNTIKYINRQELDKDLLYLKRILEIKSRRKRRLVSDSLARDKQSASSSFAGEYYGRSCNGNFHSH